ncbi:DUF7504 family protein [Haladaptatus cibarius]|uniref:DUF7504 family protein n=1 Tax=Haladaptatus cibarius TaxID=453847 RepID=UPI000679E6C0|nr:hypothetical protein [Haladaptatus cibarius]
MPSGQRGDDATVEFTRMLQQLKRRGCNLLLVGSVPDSVLSCASRKFFGDPHERRFRVVVLTGTSRTTVDERIPMYGTHEERTAVITHLTELADYGVQPVRVDSGVPELSTAVSSAITSFETDDGLQSGQLRVGLDSLESLFERYDPEVVRQFLGVVTGQVRGANGMGHFILPRDYDHELVSELAPLFDGIIEYRVDGEGQEQWHFPHRDLQSPWLSV